MQIPKLTIGMATFNDFEGVWATVQSVFLHNDWDSPSDVEIVIVDTSPKGGEHRRLVQDFVAKGGHDRHGSRTLNIKYVDMAGHVGTTLPRDVIFEKATAPVVCVMDCHVMLRSGALKRIMQWFEANPECRDLIHGPMVYDNLDIVSTHFADQFRGGMWGTWGSAWRCSCGQYFVCETSEITDEHRDRASDGKVHYHDLMTLAELPTRCSCGIERPTDLDWPGHERKLEEAGFVHAGKHDDEAPFEIPGCGMGLFACRRDAWLGFAKGCTGFGGEEMNIHTKYRQAGHKAICLPWLKWNHRFGRAGGAPYPLSLAAKLRNYVLWAKELNLPLDRIHTHFVASGQFSEANWAKLTENPKDYPVPLEMPKQTSEGGARTLDDLFQHVAVTARDLSQHAERVRQIASRVGSITGFVKRADWETILAAGFPRSLTIYQAEQSPLTGQTHAAVKLQESKDSRKIDSYMTHHGSLNVDPFAVDPIEPCDLLVIDRDNDGAYLFDLLQRHAGQVKQLILVRGTGTFGEKSELNANDPGLYYGIQKWIAANPDWFVAEHHQKQYGFTLLACDPITRPASPIVPWPLGFGPGTELKAILSSVGINASPSCSCNARMKQMDNWGIGGCEEHFDEIVGWMVENAEKWGWTHTALTKAEASDDDTPKLSMADKLKIGWKTLTTGLAFKINPLDPYPSLVREAINRAVANQPVDCTSKKCDPQSCKKPACQKKRVA